MIDFFESEFLPASWTTSAGQSETNAQGVSNADVEFSSRYPLTEKGRQEVAAQAAKIAAKGADLIVASDFQRTKETAHIIAAACGIPENKIVYDIRLREYMIGAEREGRSWAKTDDYVRTHGPYPGMETASELKTRVFSAMSDMEKLYKNKKIIIVSHGAPLNTLMRGISAEPSEDKILHTDRRYFLETAAMHDLDFVLLPHDKKFDLDLHRPYIDNVECVAPDGPNKGEKLVRVPEVFDCWFESGSMPYGEACYKGVATEHFNPKGRLGGVLDGLFGGKFSGKVGWPADFIAEGQDQTRGWFYSMMVLGVGLFGESPYKNVVANGIVLTETGEKMSKHLRNYPDPLEVINRYGADSLRYYLISSPVVAAQDLCFSEKGVDDVSKKLLQRLDNVLAFYEMYATTDGDGAGAGQKNVSGADSKNILDRWIIARLRETRDEVTKQLDLYQLDKAARPLMSFVDDLSTWYLRRSRDRFKADGSDKAVALGATRYILNEFAKISAPFLPFYADYLYSRTKRVDDSESVHLCDWPAEEMVDVETIKNMAETRRLVTVALQERSKANIKVRQPLAKLSIKNSAKDAILGAEFIDLIKDEVNVKEVVVDAGLAADTLLDTVVTEDLRKEGIVRDLIRAIQDLRKKDNLTVGDKVALLLDSDEKGKELVRAFVHDIKRITLVTGIEYAKLPQAEELKVEEYSFRISLKK